jgi:aminopeptidase N
VSQRDFWKALNTQAHKDGSLAPGLELYRLMNAWTSRPGFPVVTVGRNYTARSATITQVCCRIQHLSFCAPTLGGSLVNTA